MTLSDAAKRLPNRPHLATLYRWASRGIRGVVLETIKVGKTRFTSSAALQEFAARLSQSDQGNKAVSSRSRERRLAKAEAELDAAGIRDGDREVAQGVSDET